MELAFAERDLRDMCLNEQVAINRLGTEPAQKLKGRIADLMAARVVNDLLPFDLIHVSESPLATIEADLGDGWKLVAEPGHGRPRITEDGQVDWARVTRLKVLNVEQSQ